MRRLLTAALAIFVVLTVTAAAHGQESAFLGKSLDRWQKDLHDPQAKVRRSAAFALGRMGAAAFPRVGELLQLLRSDPSAAVRDMAACALGDITKSLRATRRVVLGEDEVKVLLKAASDPEARVRRSVLYALGCFGDLSSFHDKATVLAAYRNALHDRNPTVRQNAAWAIGQGGPEAAAAVADLTERLTDRDALVRRDAASALGDLGPKAAPSVPALIDLAGGETDGVVRAAALISLAQLAGPEHRHLAPKLDGILKDKEFEVALNAAIVLARIGGDEAANAIPVLRKGLKDTDIHNQEESAAALARPGKVAAPAVMDLADALTKGSSPKLRLNAAVALGHIALPEAPGKEGHGNLVEPAVSALVGALKASEPIDIRQQAAEALALTGYPANKAAIPAMLEAIQKDTDPTVRQRCVWAFFKAMNDLEPLGIVPTLEKVLDEKGFETALVRYDAARLLAAGLGPKAPAKTVDVLLDMLNNKTLRVFNSTDANVEGAGSEARSGRTSVQQNLGGDARYMAVQALGFLGPKAARNAEVVKGLKEAAGDRDTNLSAKAKEVLKDLKIN